jgi:hypothetical protein
MIFSRSSHRGLGVGSLGTGMSYYLVKVVAAEADFTFFQVFYSI